jgi:predicted nucleic acid-binding protein
MMQPVLIDTNLLVYAYDLRDPSRQAFAVRVLSGLARGGIGCLSVQSLSEFFSATTRQRKGQSPVLPVSDAIMETEKLARAFLVYPVTQLIVLEALRGVRQYQLSFWDSQIWAAAHLNQISTVFSEDFSPGAVLEGVQFVNPFHPGFRLQDWLSL